MLNVARPTLSLPLALGRIEGFSSISFAIECNVFSVGPTGVNCFALMGNANSQEKRAVILIRCSGKEAEGIRQAATQERRTISGYVLQRIFSENPPEVNPPSGKPKSKAKKRVTKP